VAFPDPAQVALQGERVSLVPLSVLIELELASGISAPHRLRDLADVLELIRIRKLGEDFADSLDPSVRAKYVELCAAAKHGAGTKGSRRLPRRASAHERRRNARRATPRTSCATRYKHGTSSNVIAVANNNPHPSASDIGLNTAS
jgi:hypothetical protein